MDNNVTENGSSNLRIVENDGLSQGEFLQIVLHHRWTILSITILSLVAAFIYILKATPIYTSASRLYVEQAGPRIINEYEGIMTRSKNYLYTQGELIKSTPIIAEVADNAEVKRLKTFENMDNIVTFLKNNMNVSVGKKDDIIKLSFDSAYPEEAAQVVNEVVNSYIRYHSVRKRTTVSEVLRILQKEKVKRDKELSLKFQQMLEFTRTNGVISFDNKGGHIVFDRLSKLSSSLTEAQLATVNKKADYEAAKSMANEPEKIRQFAAALPAAGVRVFVNDVETQLKIELKEEEVELQNAKYYCTEDHPSIQAIRTRINQINQQLENKAKGFADAYIEVMRLKWITAKQREDELQTSFTEQLQSARDLGIQAVEYSALQSELRRLERLCEILDDRIKELNVTEDVGALNISILEAARPADRPTRPQKTKIMAMALAIGFLLGGGLALLRDWLDYRLRTAEEISAILGVPVLGVVPRMTGEHRIIVTQGQKVWLKLKTIVIEVCRNVRTVVVSVIPKRKKKTEKQTLMARAAAYRALRNSVLCGIPRSKVKSAVLRGDKTTSENQSIIARGQKVHLESKSIVAEAYRTIRTAVFFGAPKGEAKTILVTSPAAGDGKSTLASNLAIAMAKAGQKTLVIDGDFRRPVQHKIFEISEEKGLSSVLAGKCTLEEAIQPRLVKGLDILSCGPEVPNPSELLNSETFAEILNGLTKQYDRIIIDSPPVGPVADSQILAAICDVALLVLRAEKSTRKHSQQARDSLLSVGGHLLGAIVNDVSQKHGRYGYYSGYGYYGGYGNQGYYGYYGDRKKKTG